MIGIFIFKYKLYQTLFCMKSLKQHIKDNEVSLISLNEKLEINKNYKMSSNMYIENILSVFNKISKNGKNAFYMEICMDKNSIKQTWNDIEEQLLNLSIGSVNEIGEPSSYEEQNEKQIVLCEYEYDKIDNEKHRKEYVLQIEENNYFYYIVIFYIPEYPEDNKSTLFIGYHFRKKNMHSNYGFKYDKNKSFIIKREDFDMFCNMIIDKYKNKK